MQPRALRFVVASSVALGAALLPALAPADVVPPRPPDFKCPPGTTEAVHHGGHYCAPPPPASCPPGFLPRVQGTVAYCEPPPERPCPPGSEWRSRGPEDLFCGATQVCKGEADCEAGASCVPTAFCLEEVCFRCGHTRVAGTCQSDADCGGRGRCQKADRCEPKKKRGPGGWVDAPPAVSASGSASAAASALPLPKPAASAVVATASAGAATPSAAAAPGASTPAGSDVGPGPRRGGCGSCAVGVDGRHGGGVLAALGLGLALAAARVRRRRC